MSVPPRPFLKWAGGKSWLVPTLLERIGEVTPTQTLYEPFCGSGALSLAFLHRHLQVGAQAVLGDQNLELIQTFRAIQYDVGNVISALRQIDAEYREDPAATYAALRAAAPTAESAIAARMIALNRTCFNGLYRQNQKGQFNVPMGRYENPKILDESNLVAVACFLRERAFVDQLDAVKWTPRPGDIVYLDPPYLPVSATSNFKSYLASGWTEENADALAERVIEWAYAGVRVLISDADTPSTRMRWARWSITSVASRRRINSKADRRGVVGELLIDTQGCVS